MPAQLDRDLSIRDLTDPAAGPHALQLVLARAAEALATRWGCEVRWWRGDRIVTIKDNYDNLGYRADDITRDSRYTRYVDDKRMLRSHSSAWIPGALRALAADPADDVLLVCPGLVYRRDTIDRLHTGTPHQLDLWRVTRRSMTTSDLDEMVATLVEALLPGAEHRSEDRVHPYTLSGRQVDVERDGEWIEVAECGLAHPQVLVRAGLDSVWSGLALGMGLDRMLMLLKGIPDIRILRSTEPAVAAQLTDLAAYRLVSGMPAIRRDISVVVAHDDLAEDLGDRIREALGSDADCVEEVEILAQTPCTRLPPQALQRLGARLDQKNVLVKVVLRHLDRTLTDHEANVLRDRVYAAVHQGTVHQWAV
ncbi:PheS-related mystery ligase SrmL [Kibdelosporangium aridum]|uniref:PheS-related mystery ligase SrmL n=1 Tax=Kibdelosporangium aridum TaxID=2030 RepID=UPI000526A8DB